MVALDFALNTDALARGLDSLSPKLYGASARATLDAQNQMSSALFSRLFGQSFSEAAGGVRMFATPFGGYSRQRARSSVEGYAGLNAGTLVDIEKFTDESAFGAHLAYQCQKLEGEDADRFSGNGFYAGVHGLEQHYPGEAGISIQF